MSERDRPGFLQRNVARIWRGAAEQQERELKQTAFQTIWSNKVNAKVTETVEDSYLWVDDETLPIEWRVRELVDLVGRLSTFAEGRQDRVVFQMRSNFHAFVHDFWFGRAIPYMKERRRMGRMQDSMQLPLGKVIENVTVFAEKYVIPMGKDCVDATFGKDFHSPQFVLAIQTPPQFPFMQDQRFSGGEGGEGSLQFTEELAP